MQPYAALMSLACELGYASFSVLSIFILHGNHLMVNCMNTALGNVFSDQYSQSLQGHYALHSLITR